MSIPTYPAEHTIPSRILPSAKDSFLDLKKQAREAVQTLYGIDLSSDTVAAITAAFDAHQGEDEFEAALPWLLEYTFHRTGPLSDEVKATLPLWFWEAVLIRVVTMGRWEGLQYVSEDKFYEGMGLFRDQQASADYELIHYWRRKRTDDMGLMPAEVIENLYRKQSN